MNYVELYDKYALELKVSLSDVVYTGGQKLAAKYHLVSSINYWHKGKTHRLYIVKMGVFNYGYIDLVSGKVHPNTTSPGGDVLSVEEVARNKETVSTTWRNILLFWASAIQREADRLREVAG